MKTIPLSQGKVAIVDDCDFERLARHKWTATHTCNCWYAVRFENMGPGLPKKNVGMHREIMQPAPGVKVDHVNHDGLDNRRRNLRFATTAENAANQRKPRRGSNEYKGVSFHRGKWQASIRHHGALEYLGRHATPQDAALVYNDAAKRIWGDFATLNVIEGK